MAGDPHNDCQRIVRSWSGPGTGETHYETADGRVWVPHRYTGADTTTGVTVGYRHNNHICPNGGSRG